MSTHCSAPSIVPDRMVYFVLCDYGSGLAWAERVVDRINLADTITDIHSGELPNVRQVIEVNIAEVISRDVTEDTLKAAGKWNESDPPLFGTERVNWLHDRARDLRKHEVAS